MHNKSILETCASLAKTVAECRSADPNTKVGACLYEPRNRDFHLGYNGFPSGLPENPELWAARLPTVVDSLDGLYVPVTKYMFVNHAEGNAIRKAIASRGLEMADCTLVVTHYPCHRCLIDHILPVGIRTIYYLDPYPPDPVSDYLWQTMKIQGGLLTLPSA